MSDPVSPSSAVVSEDAGRSITYLSWQVVRGLTRIMDARMAAHGLTDAQWRPLWMLRTGRARTTLELARLLDQDPGAMTRLVDRLEAKQLLLRERSQTDRRVVNLILSPEGEAAIEAVPNVLAGVHHDALAGFSQTESRQLRQLLERMLLNVQSVPDSGATPPSP